MSDFGKPLLSAIRRPRPRAGDETWALCLVSDPDPAMQMAIDHALADAVWAGKRPPTLRLYHWHHPAVTVGRLQRFGDGARPPSRPTRDPGTEPHPNAEMNPHPNIGPHVRRPTGGRAVYHDRELTFTIALPHTHPLVATNIPTCYRNMIAPVCHALTHLGATLSRDEVPPTTTDADRFACFSARTRDEPEIAGHKVAALAQRLTARGLLVQASIPLCAPRNVPPGAGRASGLQAFLPGIQWHQVANALLRAWHHTHPVGFVPSTLSPAEQAHAAKWARIHDRDCTAMTRRPPT